MQGRFKLLELQFAYKRVVDFGAMLVDHSVTKCFTLLLGQRTDVDDSDGAV